MSTTAEIRRIGPPDGIRSRRESGVTLIEMMIALLVLSIGLVALAQLYVAATMNHQYVIDTSGGINDGQRLIEQWKYYASVTGSTSPTINATTSTITTSTYASGQCTAFVNALGSTGYTAANSQYQESVWVFDSAGSLVGTAGFSCPVSGLQAPTVNSRLIYIQMVPKTPDPRVNQTLTMMAVIGGK